MSKNHQYIFGRDLGIGIFARQWGNNGVFLIGLLLYWSAQIGGIQLPTILQRSVPSEPDDAYSYILKSSQMQACFWQDCPAMEDLRRQLTAPSSDWNIAWERERQYACIVNWAYFVSVEK